MKDEMPLILLGPKAPPIGGVSIFVQRRVAQLTRGRIPHIVLDWRALSRFQRMRWLVRFVAKRDYARFELNDLLTLPMAAIAARRRVRSVRLRVHSGRFAAELTGVRRIVFAKFLAIVDDCVVVGPHVADRLANAGFVLPPSTRVEHAFLPPDVHRRAPIWQRYPIALHDFVEWCDPVIVMQGADGLEEGVDLYGADVAVEGLSRLLQWAPRAGLVIGRPSVGDSAFRRYCDTLSNSVESLGLSRHVFYLTGERELWPLIERADLFLRPTTTDGDSVSVREALFFGVPVVASDVCPRPGGVHVFSNGCTNDFVRQMRNALSGWSERRPRNSSRTVSGSNYIEDGVESTHATR